MGTGLDRRIRFGQFELDATSGELTKHGRAIRLQPQPAQVLAALLKRPGEVVTREELRTLIWGEDTFVDFDHGLNKAVNKLREVLNDSPAAPRFIETVPRRGYRFVGSVTSDSPAEDVQLLPSRDPEGVVETGSATSSSSRWRVPFGWQLAAGTLSLALLLTVLFAQSSPSTLQLTGSKQLTNDGRQKMCVQTDGRRVFFLETSNVPGAEEFHPAYVSIAGGEAVPIATNLPLPGLFLFDVSPDGSELLMGVKVVDGRGGRFLWTMPSSGGAARRLGNLRAWAARFSPDGNQIVFVEPNSVRVADRLGGNERKILDATRPNCPAFLPDGLGIRFTDGPDGGSQVVDVRLDGTHVKRTPSDDAPEEYGHWTPDGRLFAYARNGQLWSIPRSSVFFWSPLRGKPITFDSLFLDYPAPDPQKRQIYAIGSERRGELVQYDRSKGTFEAFSPALSAHLIEFSPDRESMVYVTYPDSQLWRSRRDGSGRVLLASGFSWVLSPRWSPDGSQIAFSAWVNGSRKIFLVPSNGGVVSELIPGSPGPEDSPNWSPDGKRIVFAPLPQMDYTPGGPQGKISIIDLQTRKVDVLPGTVRVWSPRLSPDGKYISAVGVSHETGLMLYTFSDSSWRHLGDGGGFARWSRDSRHIYLERNNRVFRVGIDGSEEQVADMSRIRRASTHWAPWWGLTPDEQVIVLKDVGNQEIVSLAYVEH